MNHSEEEINDLLIQKLGLEKRQELIESQLSKLEVYKQLIDTKKKIEDVEKRFREAALKYLKENDIQSTTGPAGTITLVTRNNIKITDLDKVPDDLKELRMVPKIDVIERNVKLLGVEIPGVENKKTEYVRISKPKEVNYDAKLLS